MTGRRGRLALLAAGLVAALAAAVAVGAWIASDDEPQVVTTSGGETAGRRSVAATGAALGRQAAPVGHVVYWAGPVAGRRYELTRTQDGRAYVRYLTGDAVAGDVRPQFLTVGTYPVDNAFGVTQAGAARDDARRVRAPSGAIAFTTTSRPQSVYLAYEGSDLQIEVYHPKPLEARRLVETGRIRPVG